MEFRSYLKSNVTQYKMGRISYNKVNLYDSWLSDMLPPVEMSYVDFEMKDYLLQEYNPGNALLYGFLFLDDVQVIYARNVQTFSFAFSLTGGLFTFISMIISFLVTNTERNSLFYSVMKKLFQVDRRRLQTSSQRSKTTECTHAKIHASES